MSSPRPGGGWEAIGRTQSVRTRGHWAIDYVSQTSDLYTERLSHRRLNRSTVAEIQTKVVKHGKRSSVSRFFRSKGDRDKIAVWRNDLIRILHVFNVRQAGYVGRPSLINLITDRANHQHQHNGCGYAPERVDGAGKCLWQKRIGRCCSLSIKHRVLTAI